MLTERFRLTRSIMAVCNKEGKSACVMIPENAVVVVEAVQDADRLLRVRWEREKVLVFAQDLRERGTVLPFDSEPTPLATDHRSKAG